MAMIDTLQAITYTVARTRNPNVWMDADVVFRKLGKPTIEAGYDIHVPIKVFQHPVETYLGLTPAVLDTTDFQRAFHYPWRLVRAPMVYDGYSILQNSGNKNSIVKLVTSILENSEDALTNKMVVMFFGAQSDVANTVTPAAAGTEFNSFQHLANANADGVHGSTLVLSTASSVVVGGLSKTTFPRISGYTSDFGGATHGPHYNNLSNLLALLLDGARQPDIYAGYPNTVLTFSKTQQGNQRWINDANLTAGFEAYSLFGKPFYAQRHVPYSAATPASNRILAIDTKAIQCYIHRDRNFIVEPFVKLQGQDGWASYRLVAGNFTSDDPQRLGIGHNFDPNDITD